MSAESESVFTRSAVDLPWIAAWLRKRGAWLVVATFVGGALGLLVSLLLPVRYASSAHLLMMEPTVQAQLDDQITVEPVLPEQSGLGRLAEAPALLQPIYQTARNQGWIEADLPFERFMRKMWATQSATNQLELTVRSEKPEFAAALCNEWARRAANHFNDLFGVGEAELQRALKALDQKQHGWNKTADALAEMLGRNRGSALEVRVEQAGTSLRTYLEKIRTIDLLRRDLSAFERRLTQAEEQAGEGAAHLGDAISLLGLKQAAARTLDGVELQIASAGNLAEIADAGPLRVQARQLTASLKDERKQLMEEVSDLEKRLIKLTSELEAAEHEVARLTAKRDLARSAYEAMATHVEDIRLASSGDGNAVKIAASAVPAEDPDSPGALKLIVPAAATALVLTTLLLLLWDRSAARHDGRAAERPHRAG